MLSLTRGFAAEFRRSGLSLDEARAELGLSRRQITRYLDGDTRVPKLVSDRIRDLGNRRTLAKPDAPFRFIDLFAGIGGLRLGFESIGGKCVFTSEWDRWSQMTYARNFPDGEDHVMAGDITPYGADPSRIPAHDVLLAGFPCQPFSLAGVSKKNSLGRKHGFDDVKQGNLFFEIERILRHHRPVAFLLENVKHLKRHDQGRTFEVIRKTLEDDLGYAISYRVISSAPWVPQNRERIFIAGFREDVGFSFDDFEKMLPPEQEWPRLGDILLSHNEVDAKYTLTPKLWQYLQDYRAKHEKAGNGFGYSMFGRDGVTRTLSARYHKDGSEILIAQRGTRPRRLTPVECARLMGFEHGDRKWDIPVSDTQAYRQFGNAVVVPAVEAVARYMEPAISRMLERERAAATPVKRKRAAVG
ncbi:DNA (cytosine-5-)-methyltransferase [Sphingomonas oligophenolica]|uniref:Cytosine-specific methyltransferase n=1 Tax=Sphingomonas oligophenolica TaxID=301154 RepID=A0A502BW12_9SPHN|nr:DNA (cytosine-5-)-methyltransferase [Sphingomonas oligophenolica]TPG04039.1 DNA (cytosine-5-)-methyltransferase [Sphingomonas oligophenolica]